MATKHRPVIPFLLAFALGAAAGGLAPRGACAQTLVTGTVVEAGQEPVLFNGHASVNGRVIRDPDFGAPPVLELVVDLAGVTARGVRSGQAYQVQDQAIVRRPLLPFEQVEVPISFAPRGDAARARSAVASFAVRYSEARGLSPTPVKIEPRPPS